MTGLALLCVVPMAALCDGAYAIVAGGWGRRVRGSARAQTRLDRATGVIYVGLAGLAAAA